MYKYEYSTKRDAIHTWRRKVLWTLLRDPILQFVDVAPHHLLCVMDPTQIQIVSIAKQCGEQQAVSCSEHTLRLIEQCGTV